MKTHSGPNESSSSKNDPGDAIAAAKGPVRRGPRRACQLERAQPTKLEPEAPVPKKAVAKPRNQPAASSTESVASVLGLKKTATKKRKHPVKDEAEDGGQTEAPAAYRTVTKRAKAEKKPVEQPEKRLRKFRAAAPVSFREIFSRATSQRFYVLFRERHTSPTGVPSESLDLAGTTGNIYTVTITHIPTCTCPHATKGHQCKHILYVMSRVLRAKLEHVYQLALLSSELCEIFEKAPSVGKGKSKGKEKEQEKGRKPVEDDCPICFSPLIEDGRKQEIEAIVWCQAACGQNMHKECFDMWAKTKRQQGHKVTCPFCRSQWQETEVNEDMLKKVHNSGKKNEEGYVNVADQLGISTERDYSVYSEWWRGNPDRRTRYYR